MTTPNNLPDIPFDDETWRQLPDFLAQLPQPVCLHIWADETADPSDREAVRLAAVLADRFPSLTFRVFPRRINYPYYPVFGIMGGTADESSDFGLRIIGLPVGYQMTSLVAAIQAVAFQGQTLEPLTRIKLRKLMQNTDHEARIELLTAADDVEGTAAAKILFGAAMAEEKIRVFLIVTDFFPEAAMRYSAKYLPHMVINQRLHYDGELSETTLLAQISKAIELVK